MGAERWVPNDPAGLVRLGGEWRQLTGIFSRNNLYGRRGTRLPIAGIEAYGPPYHDDKVYLVGDGQVTRNDGRSFQSGCPNSGVIWHEWEPWADGTPSDRSPTGNEGATRTSMSHLCNVMIWAQGSVENRTNRVNHHYIVGRSVEVWEQLPLVPNEGIYACFNRGSCIAPDKCTCPDGYSGFSCAEVLCSHNNSKGEIVGCLNGGVCLEKDDCTCPRSESVLLTLYPRLQLNNPGAVTGYTGTDCSIPMCTQGWYDPLCEGVVSGGEGCYRCSNGGNCTAPDFCTCAPEWTGYDCQIPVCTQVVSGSVLLELATVDAAKVQQYELDPCFSESLFHWNGVYIGQGNCTKPNVCTCFCNKIGSPWSDPLQGIFFKPPEGTIYGTDVCQDGFEGARNFEEEFTSCHLRIMVPDVWQENAVHILWVSITFGTVFTVAFTVIYRRIRRRMELAKKERRRSRKSSETNPLQPKESAFGHK